MEKYRKYIEYQNLKKDKDILTAMGYIAFNEDVEEFDFPKHVIQMAGMWLNCEYIKDTYSSAVIRSTLLEQIDLEIEKWVNITKKYRLSIIKTYVPYYDDIGGAEKEFDEFNDALDFARKLWLNEDFKLIVNEHVFNAKGELLDITTIDLKEEGWLNDNY
jgi:hypothetical protein